MKSAYHGNLDLMGCVRFFLILNLAGFCLLSNAALAATLPNLTNIDSEQLGQISHTFSTMVFLKPVEPASNFGIGRSKSKRFGLSLGAQIGEVSAIKIRQYYSSTVGLLPTAMFVLAAGGPYGLGFEMGAWPQQSFGSMTFEEYAANLKWTFTDLLWTKAAPFHLAARLGYTYAILGFAQTTAGLPVHVQYVTNVVTSSISLSKTFGLFEPYVGLGLFRQSSTLAFDSTISLFNMTFTLENKMKAASQHLHFFSGFQMHFLLASLGLEYMDVGGINGYLLKVGLKY